MADARRRFEMFALLPVFSYPVSFALLLGRSQFSEMFKHVIPIEEGLNLLRKFIMVYGSRWV